MSKSSPTDPPDDSASVIPIFGSETADKAEDEQRPLHTKSKHGRDTCWVHGRVGTRVELDEKTRRVYCVACGDEVPAFDVLMELAHEWEAFNRHRTAARQAASSAQQRVDDLKRIEANARSRIRRAEKKAQGMVADSIYMLRCPEHGFQGEDSQHGGYRRSCSYCRCDLDRVLVSVIDEVSDERRAG